MQTLTSDQYYSDTFTSNPNTLANGGGTLTETIATNAKKRTAIVTLCSSDTSPTSKDPSAAMGFATGDMISLRSSSPTSVRANYTRGYAVGVDDPSWGANWKASAAGIYYLTDSNFPTPRSNYVLQGATMLSYSDGYSGKYAFGLSLIFAGADVPSLWGGTNSANAATETIATLTKTITNAPADGVVIETIAFGTSHDDWTAGDAVAAGSTKDQFWTRSRNAFRGIVSIGKVAKGGSYTAGASLPTGAAKFATLAALFVQDLDASGISSLAFAQI